MSEENVEIVRRVYEAVARRDTATVLAVYDPDIEWDLSRSLWGDLTGRAIYRGHEELRAFYREWYEAWGNYEEAVEELIEAGQRVIVVATGHGRGRASGAEVGWTQYGVWTIREGKIVRVAWFETREAALHAAGLSEQPTSQRNLEVVRQLGAAARRRDLRQLLELTDPQVEWRSLLAVLGEAGSYRGHDGIRQYLSDLDETFETFRTNIDDLVGVGDVVVAVGRIQYRGMGSGVETETPVGWVFKLRKGKVLQVRAFREPEKALDEVGLSE